MVRELESEIVVTHQLCVDMAATMRGGPPGATKLDWAIETATALARAALEGGDRVGLTTFDSRVYGRIKPGEGRPHFLRIVDKLLETKNVVEADLTELTDGELVAVAARYLMHQEGVDLRLPRPPASNDPAWARIAAGPSGELYDLAALAELVGGLLRGRGLRGAAAPLPRVGDGGRRPELERLRAFCRARGIELPYRQSLDPGVRAAGLSEALRRVAGAERSQLVVLITDLEGVLDDPAVCRRALTLLARRHHHPFVIAPFGPDFSAPPSSDAGRRVVHVLAVEERRRLGHARRELERLGIPVIVAGPGDSADALVRRFLRVRKVARRAG
jgi:uncharacterized protein (DUF58 family)